MQHIVAITESYSIGFFKSERKYYAGTPVLYIFQSRISLNIQAFS